MLGQPIYLGLIMGLLFGVVAGYDFKGIADVTMKTAAIMMLFPTMVKMIVNGLIPISNQAKKFFTTHNHRTSCDNQCRLSDDSGLHGLCGNSSRQYHAAPW